MNKYHGHYANAQDTRPSWEPKPYTQGQADLIKLMMSERDITAEMLLRVFPSRPATFADGRKVIEWLKSQKRADVPCPFCNEPKGQLAHACGLQRTPSGPSHPPSPQKWDDIPDGNYAYEYNGKTHFYRVSRRQGKGKYAGRTFVKVQERAGNDLYRMDWGPSLGVLKTIRKLGAKECGLLFGEKLGKCRFCFSDLTDEDNPYKDQFAGPDCGPKYLG